MKRPFSTFSKDAQISGGMAKQFFRSPMFVHCYQVIVTTTILQYLVLVARYVMQHLEHVTTHAFQHLQCFAICVISHLVSVSVDAVQHLVLVTAYFMYSRRLKRHTKLQFYSSQIGLSLSSSEKAKRN